MPQLSQLLGELHRRSIWQVVSGYGVGAWLVLQLAETLSSLLGLPLWFGPAVIGLLVAGLPVVVLTSAVQGGRLRGATAEIEGEDRARELAGDEPAAATATGAQRVFTWRHTLSAAGIVVALLGATTGGYLGLRQMSVGPVATLQAQGVMDFEERIILAEFDNRTTDPTIAETVTALFRIDLAQSAAIRMLEPAQMAPVLARMERSPQTVVTFDVAREIALREGVKAVIGGEVLPLGSGYVVSIRLVSVASGDVLVAARESAPDVADVPRAVDRLSAKLRERIGESLRTIQGDPPLAEVTTRSLEALESYAQAQRANDQGAPRSAISLLEAALAHDSAFSMAHRKLGIILSNLNQDPDRMREAFSRAYEGRDRLTDRERLLAEAAYHNYVMGDSDASVRSYEALLARYPTDPTALNNLAIAYTSAGRDVEAEGMYRRAVETGAAPPSTYTSAIRLQYELGMLDRADSTFARLVQDAPDYPGIWSIASTLAASRFDYDEATRQLEEMRERTRGNPFWESQALLSLSGLRLLTGRTEESVDLVMEGFDLADRANLGFIAQPRSIFEAQVRASLEIDFYGDTAAALARLDRITAGPAWDSMAAVDRDHLGLAALYALGGAADRARALIAQFESEITTELRASAIPTTPLEAVRAWIAFDEGRFDDAIQGFRRYPEIQPGCPICGIREVGQAFLASGRPDSAIVAFQTYVDTPMLDRAMYDAGSLWRVFIGLGTAYETTGQPDPAIEAYNRFLELWNDADPGVQHHIDWARTAVARLSGG